MPRPIVTWLNTCAAYCVDASHCSFTSGSGCKSTSATHGTRQCWAHKLIFAASQLEKYFLPSSEHLLL